MHRGWAATCHTGSETLWVLRVDRDPRTDLGLDRARAIRSISAGVWLLCCQADGGCAHHHLVERRVDGLPEGPLQLAEGLPNERRLVSGPLDLGAEEARLRRQLLGCLHLFPQV